MPRYKGFCTCVLVEKTQQALLKALTSLNAILYENLSSHFSPNNFL